MEQLFQQTQALYFEAQANLTAAFANNANGNSKKQDAGDSEKRIDGAFIQMGENVERLDILVSKEMPSRRQKMKLRLEQLRQDITQLQAAFRSEKHKRDEKVRFEADRQALLSTRFDSGTSGTPDAHTQISMDYADMEHRSRLANSHKHVDDLITVGATALDSLRAQRSQLRGAQKRLRDFAETVGLSRSVIQLIERRSSQDYAIFFACAAAFCFFMYVSWLYLL